MKEVVRYAVQISSGVVAREATDSLHWQFGNQPSQTAQVTLHCCSQDSGFDVGGQLAGADPRRRENEPEAWNSRGKTSAQETVGAEASTVVEGQTQTRVKAQPQMGICRFVWTVGPVVTRLLSAKFEARYRFQ